MNLFGGIIFGVIGVMYLKLGKSKASLPMAMIGLTLLVFPYFIEQTLIMWIVGIALSIIPIYLRPD